MAKKKAAKKKTPAKKKAPAVKTPAKKAKKRTKRVSAARTVRPASAAAAPAQRAASTKTEPRTKTLVRLSARSAGPDGRFLIKYDDNDGITLLVDREALERRYAPGGDTFRYDVPRELLEGINRHELIAFGTHHGGFGGLAVLSLTPFDAGELTANGIRSTLDAGLLRTSGDVVLCDWAQFTYACAHQHGHLENGYAPASPRSIPAGLYRVTVHRSVGHEDSPVDGDRLLNLLYLERVPDDTTVPELDVVPGSDGFFA